MSTRRPQRPVSPVLGVVLAFIVTVLLTTVGVALLLGGVLL